ncbi:DNA-binding transcriptional regulator, LysR family [Variovorax sp. HW608]|uniref:LysR family transcriptional regulator n=1 Tax=Variovorax sp. HW608 TaxID=1034889 RepID=UPI0008201CA1|nr:LysR family transcriptional regulator [Variovorax sp. HW608]SCK14694.1 DNA-binding transcriptional regulator, LysR family [Variovorax sp. HW608]
MNLEDLRTFVEVADTGGVAQAARRLGQSKSIVSRRLAQLEEVLGVQLLSRTTRGSALTEAGATFREHAARVLSELEAASDALSPEGPLRGYLRVAAPLSFGVTQLSRVLAELARRHPLLNVDTSYSDRFVDLVGEGFDCGIRLGLLPDSSMLARRICAFRGMLVASPEYLEAHGTPLTLADLADHQTVTKKGEVWPLRDGDQAAPFRPRSRFHADNGEAILAAALAGIGIAALPDFLTQPHIAAGKLVTVLTEYAAPEAGMYVVRPPGAFRSRKVSVLTDILIEYFGDTRMALPAVTR